MPTKLNNKKSSAEFEKLGNSQDRIWGHIDVMSDSVAQTTLQVSSPTQYNRSKINDNSIPTGLRSHSPQAFAQSFDLAPPPPNKHLTTIDTLCERLFSDDHLYLILGDSTHFVRFSAFINKSKSQTALLLNRYLDTQKAIKAVEYANAVAHTIGPLPEDYSTFQPYAAASLDVRFEERSKKAFEGLVNEGLSSYVTRVLVDAVTDTLVKEITGNTMPIMRDLVAGLAEVFCLTDPSIEDNPIVYASEEFYRTTQYGRDYVIGRNCRFLQGPKTDRPTIGRISAACKAGQEICETVLNYRRDGSPFLNLLMVAPLFDNRGRVRYFIGAQVDVTGLVEDGKGIDSFERLLAEDRAKSEKAEGPTQESNGSDEPEKPLQALGQLGKMLSWEESMEVQSHTRRNSRDSFSPASSANMYGKKEVNTRSGGRRVLGDENVPEMVEKAAWGLSVSGLSGKLPGVYQYYMLVRSHPSLRIIFVSPSLRIPGLLQSNFLSRIGGPTSIRDGIEDAFAQGVPVTAKVSWLPIGKPVDDDSDNRSPDNRAYGNNVNGNSAGNRGTGNGSGTGRHAPSASSQPQQARTRWLSCTPLCGSDDRVGVWMVVMVEDTNPTRVIGVRPSFANSNADNTTNGIERLDSGRRSAMASPKHPVTNGRLAQENQVPKYTENPRSLDSPVASDDFSVRPASQSSDSSTIVPRSLPRGLTQIPPRGASKKIWPHSYSPALSPSLTPTLSPDAVQSWVPASNGPPARNSSTVDSHSNGGAHGAGGTTATTDLADQEASQTQKAFADFAAKMTAPRREGMVVSDRGVDLRNGRVMGREHGAGRVGDQGVGVAN